MTTVRCLLGGVAIGVISEIFALVVFIGLFEAWMEQAADLWRPMDSLYWKVGLPLADLFSGILISVGFLLLHRGVPGTGLSKGLNYGLIVWLISRLPGEIFYFVMFPIPFMLTVAGLVHGLLTLAAGGVALAAIFGKSLDS